MKVPKIKGGRAGKFRAKKEAFLAFGEIGLRIARAVDGKKDLEQIAAETESEPAIVEDVCSFLEEKGLLEWKTEEVAAKVPRKKPTESKAAAPSEKVSEVPQAPKEEPRRPRPRREQVPEEVPEVPEESKEVKEKPEEAMPPEPEPEAAQAPSTAEESSESMQELPVLPPEYYSAYPILNPDKLGDPGYLEFRLYDRFGPDGIKVYAAIRGTNSVSQIASETGIDPKKVGAILKFMEDLGAIFFSQVPREIVEEESAFSPLEGVFGEVSATPHARLPDAPDLLPVDLPVKMGSPLSEIQAKGLAVVRFGLDAIKVYDAIDGKKDVIQMAVDLKIPMKKLEDILDLFGQQRVVGFKPLTRDQIAERYGSDGLKIYKKFGRDGLLIYQLLEKEDMSLKDMVKFAGVPPKKGADIILFINELLGIHLPFDKEFLYKELGVDETSEGEGT